MHIYNKRMVNLLKQVPLLHHMHGSLALDAAGLVDVLERIENAGVFMLDDAHAAVGTLADNVQKGKVEEVDVALSKVCGLDADGGTTAEVGGEAFEHDRSKREKAMPASTRNGESGEDSKHKRIC